MRTQLGTKSEARGPKRLESSNEETLDLNRLDCGAARLFSRRRVELAVGASLDHDDALWQEAIVFVTAGELEVLSARGEQHRFRTGDILTFARLPILRARNSGATPTHLLAIWKDAPTNGSPASTTQVRRPGSPNPKNRREP